MATRERDYAGPCGYSPCKNEGIFRIRRGTAWISLCRGCVTTLDKRDMHDEWVAAGKPTASASMAKIKAIDASPKRMPAEHWKSVLADSSLPPYSRESARAALVKIGHRIREREPGEDDE